MAKSLCVVTLLMVFLLISTGIPKGKAQCKGELRNVVPKGTCMLGYAKVMCSNICTFQRYQRGECETQDTTDVCHCYC
ncbi:unnamed protein product [Brassica rapa subsp. trilocularis]